MRKLKVVSLFSGIGAFEKALTNIGIDFDIINYCEIDKFASTAYSAIHNVSEELNIGDIKKYTPKYTDIDLITFGFPCQDISIAGRQEGLDNTRSGLVWEALRVVETLKPKYAIAENVKNLISKKFKKDFDIICKELENIGYNVSYEVLNGKNYGIPQNRERVFIICTRKDIAKFTYTAPEPFHAKLSDFIEIAAAEKYYIPYEKSQQLLQSISIQDKINYCIPILTPDRISKRQNGRRIKEDGDDSFTLTSQDRHGIVIDANYYKGLDDHQARTAVIDDQGRGREKNFIKETAPTLKAETHGNVPKIIDGLSIRKFTPKECWRLMGFTDEDYHRAKSALESKYYKGKDRSDSQMYKMAGNSIIVTVLEDIFKQLLGEIK